MSLRPQGDETLSSVYVDDYKMAGKAENVSKMWARLGKRFDLEPPVPFHNTVYLGCQQTNITIPEQIVKDRAALMSKILDKHNQTPSAQTDKSATTESPVRGGKATSSAAKSQNLEPVKAWRYSMKGHAQQCVERYTELSGKTESNH